MTSAHLRYSDTSLIDIQLGLKKVADWDVIGLYGVPLDIL